MVSDVVVYSIKDWDKKFETSETRKLKRLSWVPVDNQHDNRIFRKISARENRSDLFSAWVLIIQIASRMPQRGLLVDESGPLGSEDMSLITGFPESIFKKALIFYADPAIGWVSAEYPECFSGNTADSPSLPGESAGTPVELPEEGDLASNNGQCDESAGITAGSPDAMGKSAGRIERNRTDRQGIEGNRIDYDNSGYVHAHEELSSLSFLRNIFEEKDIWIDTIAFLKANKEPLEVIARIYTDSQKDSAKSKQKAFDEVRYLRQVKRGLIGEIEWDIEPTLTFVRTLVEKRAQSLAEWIEKIESEAKKAQEDADRAEKEKLTLDLYERLPEYEKAELWKLAQDIESRSDMAKLGFKPNKRRINERIARLMEEQGYLEDAEVMSCTQ